MKLSRILHQQAAMLKRNWNRADASSDKPGAQRLRHRRPQGHVLSRDDGGAIVEFALVMPMFLVLITGMFAFGITMNNYLELTNAAGAGARAMAASAQLSSSPDPCQVAYNTATGLAPNLTAANMTFKYTINGTGGITGSTCAADGVSTIMVAGQPATLEIDYPCSLPIFGLNFGCTLKAVVTEQIQ